MSDLVDSGEVPAAIGVEVNSPDVKPLIANAKEAGIEALRSRGHYPSNHLVVVTDEVLDAHADLAPDIFQAFTEAKRLYVQKLQSGAITSPTPADEVHRRVMETTGRDPLPYGIAPNRQALEELIQSALEQKIITRPVSVEELFASNTHALTG